MSYLALYRKYRPETFDGLIGQEHIARTLVNQIKENRVGHAYLFTGSRGTGKTSAAKIFAKAVNCLSPVNGSPCGKCAVCEALSRTDNLDVIEMDAASNNGVNEIRDLREKVAYPPVSSRYKVYIVDEVHMLTQQAFNALLKTLEEPPKHAVFILATTEVQKMPATILSRCMRFDFKLVDTEKIAALLKKIFAEQNKEYEEEAVTAIARAGEGSVRDALSIADMAISFNGGKLTYSDVLQVLGASDSRKVFELCESVLKNESGRILETLDGLISEGRQVGVINKDIVSLLRDLLVAKTCSNPNAILALPKDKYAALSALAGAVTCERLLRCLEIFSKMDADLRYTVRPRALFETALIRAARPETDFSIEALTARISELENKIARGITTANAANSANAGNAPETLTGNGKKQQVAAEDAAVTESRGLRKDLKLADAKEVAGRLIGNLRKSNNLMLWGAVQGVKTVISDGNLVFEVQNRNDGDLLAQEESKKTVKQCLSEYGDFDIKINVVGENKHADLIDDKIDEMKKIFGDDIVIIK